MNNRTGFTTLRTQIYHNLVSNKMIYIGILFAAFSLFYVIRNIVLATHDDLSQYITVCEGLAFERAIEAAKIQGRFWFIVNTFFEYLPMLFRNWYIFKIFSYVGLAFSAICLGCLLSKHISKESGLLAVLLFFSLVQLDNQHNILVSYIFWRQIDIGFAFLSLSFFLDYMKKNKRSSMTIAIVFYMIAAILYESFILMLGLFLVISFCYHYKKRKLDFKALLKDMLPLAISAAIYLLIYFAWRVAYPSQYVGNIVDSEINIIDSLRTMFVFSFGKFPLFTSLLTIKTTGITLHDFLKSISFLEIFNAVLVTAAYVAILRISKKKLENAKFWFSMFIGLIFLFIPTVLQALTSQYKDWVVNHGITSYVPSVTCFFILAAMIAIICLYLHEKIKHKRVFTGVTATLLFSAVIVTGVSNKLNAEFLENQRKYFDVVDILTTSNYLDQNINNDSQLYLPQYISVPYDREDAERYIFATTSKQLDVVFSEEELDFSVPVYMLIFDDNSKAFMVGQIDEDLSADSICIIKDEYTESVSLVSKNNTVKVSIEDDIYSYQTNTANLNLPAEMKEIIIDSDDINIKRSTIFEEAIKENNIKFDVDFVNGFYIRENNEFNSWNWCGPNGTITLNNEYEPIFATPRFTCSTGEGTANLTISYCGKSQVFEISQNATEITLPYMYPTGKTTIDFSCDGGRLYSTSDPRELYFRVNDFVIDYMDLTSNIEYSDGFYGLETNESGMVWNWSSQQSSMTINNPLDENLPVEIEFELGIGEGATMLLTVGNEEYEYDNLYDMCKITQKITLLPGENMLKFESNTSPIDAQNDPRSLYFRIVNLSVKQSLW